MRISTFERAVNYAVLALFALVVLGPIGVVFKHALGPRDAEARRSGRLVHLDNFPEAWEIGRFGRYMLTSVVVSALVVSVSVLVSILAGYALGTMRFRGATFLFYLFLLGIMVPTEAIVVPLYFDLRELSLTNTIWGVALPQIAMSIAFGTYWMRTYFRTANRSLIDAARIDGAGSMRILWRILVPIGRPAILTLILLVFMWTWNEFLIPLIMSPGGQWRTAPLGLAIFKGQYTSDHALLAAAGVIIAAPIIIVFLMLQRYFISGMLEGASKE